MQKKTYLLIIICIIGVLLLSVVEAGKVFKNMSKKIQKPTMPLEKNKGFCGIMIEDNLISYNKHEDCFCPKRLDKTQVEINLYHSVLPLLIKDSINIVSHIIETDVSFQLYGGLEQKGTLGIFNGYDDQFETILGAASLLVYAPNGCTIWPTYCPLAEIKAGEYITISYDETSANIYLPNIKNEDNISVAMIYLWIGDDGSTYWDSELTKLAQLSELSIDQAYTCKARK